MTKPIDSSNFIILHPVIIVNLFHGCEILEIDFKLPFCNTRIMVYKGMVYKGKYWISEKNKGIPVSFFGYF